MNAPCDLARLDAALDRDATPAERDWAAAHVGECAACREFAKHRAGLDARLAAMPLDMEPARQLWPGIEGRLGISVNRVHWFGRNEVWRIAAAVVLFAGGYVVGTARERSSHVFDVSNTLVSTAPSSDPGQAAADVQRIGSAWTASLSRLARQDSVSPAVARQGREVALSMMRGAASELVRIVPDRPGVAAAYSAILEEQERPEVMPQVNRRVAF